MLALGIIKLVAGAVCHIPKQPGAMYSDNWTSHYTQNMEPNACLSNLAILTLEYKLSTNIGGNWEQQVPATLLGIVMSASVIYMPDIGHRNHSLCVLLSAYLRPACLLYVLVYFLLFVLNCQYQCK